MARIEFAPEVLDDFERILDHLLRYEVQDAAVRIAELVESLQILAHSPAIGRPAAGGKRDLIVGTGSRGYVVRYVHVAAVDTAFVLAVRSQRERGFKRRR